MRRDPGTVLEELLVASAMSGSEEAFGQLIARWTPRLIRHASHLLHDSDAARDAVQEAWVGAARGLRRLEDPARFPPWIFSLVSRRCVDSVRRAVRDRRFMSQASEVADKTARDAADEQLDLRDAVARLPVAQRLIVSLHYGEGFSVDEIAAAHGLPPGTVKSRLSAARETLRRYLEGDDYDDHR
ncbi:MAG: sigma-70 family RNA polymerase sigma factor [Sphingobium sp.]|nr:sigma-70 family RNA polymerase sigma factor [Sphingobium sp.]